MSAFTTTRRVEFRDTDAAGILHFASFFPLMESVEHEFLRSLGLSVIERGSDAPVSWPRVHADCDYRSAVHFEDVLEISLRISRLGEKSVTYQFDVRCDGRDVAEGNITAVCCRMSAGQQPAPIPIPAPIADKLRPYAHDPA